MLRKINLLLLLAMGMCHVVTAQTYQRLTNLPHVYIETENGAAIVSKTYYVNATMHYVDEDDVVTQYDGMQIRGRGNSTWNLSKKPYKIKFQEKEKFLGKGYAKAKKWTLLANAGDKTLMRNAITSLMGDFLGMKNNPAHKFVDVTLNGTYIGTYQISDQVEVRPHRVNIMEQDYPLTAESDITGGYLLEVDGFRDGNCFTTSVYEVPIRIHYPDDEEIAAAQNAYIRQYMEDFERVLSGSEYDDADVGYRKWVDSTSLVNWFLATEISGNVDGYYSTYFYKEQQDSLLYWGPLWDYDIAYNNDNRTDRGGTYNTERQLMTDNGYGKTKQWLNRMWQDPWFGRLVNRRYKEVLNAGLENYLYAQIDSIAELLQASQELNYNKWGINRRMYHEVVLYSSYDEYNAFLKAYIATHISYLKTAFANKQAEDPIPPTPPTPAFEPENYYYILCNAKTNGAIDTYDKVRQPGDLVCSWAVTEGQYSQQWQILPVNGYFMLLNRYSGMALCDPTEGEATATTNVGTTLETAVPNVEDDRQLWSIVPQGYAGYYNLVNKHTGHTANLNGGGTANGTAILSYTTDERNASSQNRLWYILKGEDEIEDPTPDDPTPDDPTPDDPTPDDPTPDDPTPDDPTPDDPTPDDPTPDDPTPDDPTPDDPTPDDPTPDDPTPDDPTPDDPTPDAIEDVEPCEYALAYNAQAKVLHFGSETPELLNFMVRIHAANGTYVRSFRASERCSVADLSRGVYLIVWNVGGKTRSAKMLIQ